MQTVTTHDRVDAVRQKMWLLDAALRPIFVPNDVEWMLYCGRSMLGFVLVFAVYTRARTLESVIKLLQRSATIPYCNGNIS